LLPLIDTKNGVPIYVQLKEGLKLLIIKGVYPKDSQLPTVRQLAVDLRINSNTVARSYTELEREGIISTQQGRGTFVCGLPKELEDDVRSQQLDGMLERLLSDAFTMGYGAGEVLQRLQQKIDVKAVRTEGTNQ
jgi:GntR family transcriptional regulator